MADPLDSLRIKLARAHTHILELDQILGPILDIGAYEIVRDPKSHSTKPVFNVVEVPKIDPAWSAIVGDALFNLRSSLDHLAQQLVILDKGKPTSKTQFPIQHSRTDEKGNLRIPNIDPGIRRADILKAIDAVQPYQTDPVTNNFLWAVNKLCNIDKHRLLLVMVCALDTEHIWWGANEDDPSPGWSFSVKPLYDGDPVAWFDFGDTEAPSHFKPNLTLTVKLDEGPAGSVIRSMPVIDFLKTAGHVIASILNTDWRFIGLLDEEFVAFGEPSSRLRRHDMAVQGGFHKAPTGWKPSL